MTLAEKLRPKSLDDILGQDHLSGQNGIVRNMLVRHELQSLIFYGPPGSGKTSLAKVIANSTQMPFYVLNATQAGITDIRNIEKSSEKPFLLYLDEIQYFNKKQQQSLLPLVESGECILIGATTENPYYALYDALLSRCIVCEFKSLSTEAIFQALQKQKANFEEKALKDIARFSSGDLRRAYNLFELASNQFPNKIISSEDVSSLIPSANMSGFDLDGDVHYGLLSGLQKSIRGSDPDGAIFYLTRLLQGGDLLSPCRRLLVIASEDIGLAHPTAAATVHSLTEIAKQLGLPEAFYPLSQAAIFLAILPKSDSIGKAFALAKEDIQQGLGQDIPYYIQNAHHPHYRYPHSYPNHWLAQDYLPKDLRNRVYYEFGDNSFEESLAKYWKKVKQK